MKERALKLSIISLVFTAVIVLICTITASAGNPHQTKHEIIVSQDSDGDYTTFYEAYQSITDASANNRYLITMKPGNYDCTIGNPFLYIDIRGSGINNTICSFLPIGSLGETVISNITLDNGLPPIQSYDGQNHEVILDRVKVLNRGLHISGNPVPNVMIMDSTINVPDFFGASSDDIGIFINGGYLLIENTYVEGYDKGIHIDSASDTLVEIRDSHVSSSNTAFEFRQRPSGLSKVKVYSSIVSGTDVLYLDSFYGTGDETFYASASQLTGNINSRPGIDKILNCFDENFNPIPNQ